MFFYVIKFLQTSRLIIYFWRDGREDYEKCFKENLKHLSGTIKKCHTHRYSRIKCCQRDPSFASFFFCFLLLHVLPFKEKKLFGLTDGQMDVACQDHLSIFHSFTLYISILIYFVFSFSMFLSFSFQTLVLYVDQFCLSVFKFEVCFSFFV